jgi:hypothetical protein
MSAHRILEDLFVSGFETPDTGASSTLQINRCWQFIRLSSAAAESRTLGLPTKAGLRLTLSMVVDNGDITVTITSGDSSHAQMVFSAIGQYADLVSIATSPTAYRWRITSSTTANT